MTTATMLQALWLAAQENVDDDTLQSLTGAEIIGFEMRNLAKVMEGVGFLIENDEVKSAGLQERDTASAMLYHFSLTLETLAEAVEISTDATALLHEKNLLRREKAAKVTAIDGRKQRRAAA